MGNLFYFCSRKVTPAGATQRLCGAHCSITTQTITTMKKLFLLCSLMGMLTACCSESKCAATGAETASDSLVVVQDEIYAGTFPAADCSGINYVLRLHAVETGKDTLFTLEATYLDAEGDGVNRTFTTTGKRTHVAHAPKKTLRLIPDNGDPVMHFMSVDSTTLRMVNDSLQVVGDSMSYDLVKITEVSVEDACKGTCNTCSKACQ